MKELHLTVYEASDGKRFNTVDECKQYEADGCVELTPLPDYGDHMPLTNENLRWMSQGDGSCYYATATRMSRRRPSRSDHPAWATHLVYFGK